MPPLAGLCWYGLAGKLSDLDYLGCCVVQIIGLALPQQLAPQVGLASGISDISMGTISGFYRNHFRRTKTAIGQLDLSIPTLFLVLIINCDEWTILSCLDHSIRSTRLDRFDLILSAPPLQKHPVQSLTSSMERSTNLFPFIHERLKI